ncbi:PTS sugar transporter subunit IIC [Staphylococcus pasteuri]|uniref:PTS sugar transporter subunit IIC n=1 Tax=Staphylococcus pasteuri TaxID=45972 RepID=UPI0003C0B9FB|nr:PTS sugar transporter subunit IIC [Staphylococcus pasteuri]AGZ25662.1 putative regulatory protein [Staphylococcus pasteuri SP1]
MGEKQWITPRSFLFNILNGLAIAIVVGMLPNAILGDLSKYLSQYNEIFSKIVVVVQGIQYTIPILTGVLIAIQFNLTQLQTAVVGAATFVGSGATTITNHQWVITGIGDLINTMITGAIAVGIILIIGDRAGSLNMTILPIVAGGIPGLLGLLLLPYTKLITVGIGSVVNSLTNTQPIIMTILIAVIFSILIVSPISAIGIAIGISGLAAGSAAVGVSASAIMLALGAWRVNKVGVPISVLLGAVKLMMPNTIRHPIIFLPVTCTAAVSGLVGGLLNIKGTPDSAGFGLIGLVGPIKSLNLLGTSMGSGLLLIAITYVIVPIISAIFFNYLFVKILKLYKPDVFIFK